MKSLYDIFFPHKGNDHHPHLLRFSGVVVGIFALVLLQAGLFYYLHIPLKSERFIGEVLPGAILAIDNLVRQESRLPALSKDSLLQKAASAKANDMARRGYFSHKDPDGSDPWIWLDRAGYQYSYAGENLAINFVDSKDVVEAWLSSPSHRANLLHLEYSETGIGTAVGKYQGKEAVFVVEFFAKPASEVVVAINSEESAQNKKVEKEIALQNLVAQTSDKPLVLGAESIVQNKETVLTSPRAVVNIILGVFSLIALMVAILLYRKRDKISHHPILAGAALVFFIVVSYVSVQNLTSGTILLPQSDVSASVGSAFLP